MIMTTSLVIGAGLPTPTAQTPPVLRDRAWTTPTMPRTGQAVTS